MEEKTRALSDRSSSKTVENPKGVFRTTMSYNPQIMLCHFILKKGALIPLHNHEAVQNGYVIRGKAKFLRADGSSFLARSGSGYAFGPGESHGAEALEETEVVECFSPMRPEYAE